MKFGSEDGRNVHASSFQLRNNAGKRSLRVAIAVIILFAVVFVLFIFTLVRLFANQDIGR
jgi:Na+-driven multidrug efflux pump